LLALSRSGTVGLLPRKLLLEDMFAELMGCWRELELVVCGESRVD
jgi:hypothetical protein